MLMQYDFSKIEIWPGPMEGVGKAEFVRTVNAMRLTERWMTPFLRLSETMPSDAVLRRFAAAYFASQVPVTIQLMGTSPQLLGKCAARLLELTPAAGINLNFGCPSSRVVKHGAGGGMLKQPEKIADFCAEVAAYLPPGKLSVKLRAGWTSSHDMEIFLPALAASQAVSKIFFHYRTVQELYSPDALPFREQRTALAVQCAGNIPVIANGDITSTADAAQLLRAARCAGIMIARPWMRDPYLLTRFTVPDAPDAETGRELFFSELRRHGVQAGALIEMAKMLWGIKHEKFLSLLQELHSPAE